MTELISFIIGIITGFAIGKLTDGKPISKDSQRGAFAFLIALIWTLSVLWDIYSIDYTTPVAIHLLAGAVVGFYFEVDIISKFIKK